MSARPFRSALHGFACITGTVFKLCPRDYFNDQSSVCRHVLAWKHLSLDPSTVVETDISIYEFMKVKFLLKFHYGNLHDTYAYQVKTNWYELSNKHVVKNVWNFIINVLCPKYLETFYESRIFKILMSKKSKYIFEQGTKFSFLQEMKL